ncbi:hypothetical protein OD350_28550 (plasmid) [Clostridium beijerinckii]|uniref:hypothetical protein n=1 Tax=Clostridium beijerinckii TaxID=1520 RepID=UPI0022261FF8|nr:hypothetical protein [Clostridium beijerinckii]UYZ39024.1 hypothetical protein OD350_28550 [Clostridium beijerinckii]
MKEISQYIIDKCFNYNIKFQFVTSEQISANASCIKYADGYFIFINSTIPESLDLLVVYHEIAHIELGYIGDKYHLYNKSIEKKVNMRALEEMKKHLGFKFYIFYIMSCFSEWILYHTFSMLNTLDIRRFL